MAIPYASATSGENARKEITKILRRFGCEEIGFMDNFNESGITHQPKMEVGWRRVVPGTARVRAPTSHVRSANRNVSLRAL